MNEEQRDIPVILPVVDGEKRPFWSVMIPTFNRPTYLARTLECVLRQDPGPERMQIEVVDNCSTEGDAEAIVKEIGKGRVGFFRQDRNVGMIRNWNTCIRRARGLWVHTLHDDDLVADSYYGCLGETLANDGRIGAAFGRVAFIDANDRVTYTAQPEQETPGIIPDFLQRIGGEQHIQMPSAAVVQRRVYEELGGFNVTVQTAADWEMWIRIAAHYPVWFEPRTMAYWRQHQTAATPQLIRTGANIVEARLVIEARKKYVPAEIEPQLRARTLSWLVQAGARTAYNSMAGGDLVAADWQAYEVLNCEPSAAEVREFSEGLGSAYVQFIAALAKAAAQYAGNPADPAAIEPLRRIRLSIARQCLEIPDDQLEAFFVARLREPFRILLESGLRNAPLGEDESALVEKVRPALGGGVGAVQAALVTSLYRPGGHGGVVPAWLEQACPALVSSAAQAVTPTVSVRESLKVAVDGVFFQMYATGIARVWKSLLEEWAASGFARHVVVLDRVGSAPKIPGVRYRTVPAYDYGKTDADRVMLQQMCDEEKADVFVSSYYTTPLTTPSIFMLYDMIPELFGFEPGHPMWREKHYGVRHASAFLSISESSKRDLFRFFPEVPQEKVIVSHTGVGKALYPRDARQVQAFRARYGITKPYLLTVGARGGYKNTILTFRGLSMISDLHNFDLVCTGGPSQLEPEFQQLVPNVRPHMVRLDDDELAAAYSGAVVLLHPSVYEGFGMPVAEAMGCGCPVITCRNSSLIEVAGDAAIFVPENDPAALVQGLISVMQEPTRSSLIAKGLEQAKKFSWTKMAADLARLLGQVGG